jgi:hypothetical protein
MVAGKQFLPCVVALVSNETEDMVTKFLRIVAGKV